MKNTKGEIRENNSCAEVRELLQQCRDDGIPIDATIAEHLRTCDSCLRFSKFLEQGIRMLKQALDDEAGAVKTPGFKSLFVVRRQRVLKRRIAVAAIGIAAALVIGAGTMWGVRKMDEIQARRQFENETEQFVDSLFSRPLLDGVEYASFEP